MTGQPSIKILVGYHRPSVLLKSDIYVPIHLGRAVAREQSKDGVLTEQDVEWLLDNMIGDDTGDNISNRNRVFCELTGMYWAWKNYDRLGDPDYIGFMHHRRHLCFDLDNKETPNRYGLLYNDKLDEEYIKKYCLYSENVTSIVSRYDVVVAEKCDLEKLGTRNCYNHYLHSSPLLHIVDYDRALKILIAKYPSYQNSVAEYNASRYGYFTNIFIMRKELFREYAEWLFPIVFESYEHLDVAHYNISEARAYISEWLFGIWYTHLKKERNINALELKRTRVRDTSLHIQRHIFPAFHTNNIALCFGADSRYVPYLAVTLRSIIENASPLNNYDICILHENISPSLQHKILGMRKANVSIRFVCIDGYTRNYRDEIFGTRPHVSKATYYRFLIPQIFERHEKVLYLDCDLAVNRDVADLYNTTLDKNYLVGVVRDCEVICRANKDKAWGHSYFNDFLRIKNVFDYFQGGVILFNVEQCKREHVVEKFMATLERIKESEFPDQDVLNIVCEGRVLFLDLKWNVKYQVPIGSPDWMKTMPVGILHDYIAGREDPWIVHFAGNKKPWHDPSFELSEYFWRYARHTPFYEDILHASIKDATIRDDALKHQVTAMQKTVAQQVRGDMDNALKQRATTMQNALTQQIRNDMGNALNHQVAVMRETVTKQVRSDMGVIANRQVSMIREVFMLPEYRRKLKRIRLKILFACGSRRQRYFRRKQELELKIKAIEKLVRGN